MCGAVGAVAAGGAYVFYREILKLRHKVAEKEQHECAVCAMEGEGGIVLS